MGMGTRTMGMGGDGDTACSAGWGWGQPCEMGVDGDRSNGDGCGWGQVLVPLQISTTEVLFHNRTGGPEKEQAEPGLLRKYLLNRITTTSI